ncbi:protease-related protein [Vibrio sp. RC586]|uniref:S41 family peptidase n=1 Tax=Vibrio sp. RC586 TaxID=675815 RepID=UPI0001BB7F60|nr:S41 family peptidase [Vibrio sp. RC586]EEY99824.1 protease-related protein [Vibrio sp. RC586]
MHLPQFTLSSVLLLTSLIAPNLGLANTNQPETAAHVRPTWLRDIALSPDGQKIAFTYAGQIWLVPAQGGEAVALTESGVYSENPVWSPDSQSIAFSSDRYGFGDVFILSIQGGESRRLTYHGAKDIPYAFSADGQLIYFSSRRLGDDKANASVKQGSFMAQLYSVPSVGGREQRVLPIAVSDVAVSPAQSEILYTNQPSDEQPWRKGAVSDATRDIWQWSPLTGKHTQITTFRGEDRNPVWSTDGTSMFYLSEQAGNFNVWQQRFDGSAPVQITYHQQLPVRFLSASLQGDLAYGFDGEIWRLKAGSEQPQKVDVSIRRSTMPDGRHSVNFNLETTEMVVAPNAAEVAIVARGDVYVVSLLSGLTQRITDTPEAERDISFSSDGYRLVYASEREGSWNLYQSYVNDGGKSFSTSLDIVEEPLLITESDVIQPLYSPNHKRIAYRENRNTLKVYDIEQDQTYTLLDEHALYSYVDADLSYQWSPDSEYLVTRDRAMFNGDIQLLKFDGSEVPLNLSQSGFAEFMPQFSADGQWVYWFTDAKGLRDIDNMVVQYDVYGVALNREAKFDFNKTQEQLWLEDEIAAEKNIVPSQHRPAELTVVENKGLKQRIMRMTPVSLDIIFKYLTEDNKTLIIAYRTGDSVQISEINLRSGEMTALFNRSSEDAFLLAMASDDESLLIMGEHGIENLNVVTGDTKFVRYQANANFDFRAEIAYLFDHVWRLTQTKFYDPKMHDMDWKQYGDLYRKHLPSIHTYNDFAELLSEMVGELNVSHTGAFFMADNSSWEEPASLGLYYDDRYRGKGVRVKSLLPGGPADTYQSPIKAGAIIYSVNGKEISDQQDIHTFLNFTQGKLTRLNVLVPGEDKAQNFTLIPISLEEESELLYEQWVEQRRGLVEKLSDGRLGYVHLAAMDANSFEQMQNDMFGREKDKLGLVVDVRFNAGGWLHDQVMEILSGTRHSVLQTRDGYVVSSFPERRWAKPSIMLANADSYSDGSIVPYFYQKEGLGKLVGERVPGTGTAVIWERQQEPGLVYGVPQLGIKDEQGRWFENQEIVPDILVYNDPESVVAGEDRQLAAAVEALLADTASK